MSIKQKRLALGLILALACLLRFFKIYQTAPFLGDQGRDLLEIRESLMTGKLPLTGPLSNEGIHAGPSYYYLVIPSLLASRFHPLGPILFTTFLGVISAYLIYWLSEKLFGQKPALAASALYASSSIVIQRTLGLWNPIPIPFFSLLIMISIYQIQVKKKYFWLAFLGFFLSFAIQLYIPAYFLILPVFAWWLLKIRLKHLKWSLLGILSFILAFLPFLVFQFQNQFTDFKNLILFFVEKLSLSSTPPVINPIALLSQQFRAILAMGPSWLILILAAIIIFLPLIKGKNRWQQFFLFWFLTGILVLTFYPGLTPPHYASFIWVLPFLLLAAFLSLIKKPKLLFIAGFVLVFINLIVYVKNFSPTNDLARSQAVSQLISQKAENQAFGILLLSNRSPSDAHFRYFLKLIDAPVISLKQNPNRLFLICTQINCPSENEVQKMKIIETECLPSCPKLSEQKSVNLNDWQYQEYFEASGVKIFYFKAADIGPA